MGFHFMLQGNYQVVTGSMLGILFTFWGMGFPPYLGKKDPFFFLG